jgi:hypothetical protein
LTRTISAKRRNKSNPWFKRGTLYRSAVDVLRRAGTPMTAREIAEYLLEDAQLTDDPQECNKRPIL